MRQWNFGVNIYEEILDYLNKYVRISERGREALKLKVLRLKMCCKCININKHRLLDVESVGVQC